MVMRGKSIPTCSAYGKNDAADTGMGIYASAQVMDMDFIPVCEESMTFASYLTC